MHFWKGHGLGNDYLVVEAGQALDRDLVRAICARHRGVGSDGVLVGEPDSRPFGLRIYNPDGSDVEKSGNGLRIFGAWLHHRGLVGREPFQVALPGETVEMVVEEEAGRAVVIRVAMNRATFRAGDVHFTGADPDQEVLGLPVQVPAADGGEPVELAVHTVSTGNPHCVVLLDELDDDFFRRYAPGLQSHPLFEQGVNVQFARVTGPNTLEIRIWERGAGETLASGSSSCAATAAALRVGRLSGRDVEVSMPGGTLRVQVAEDWSLTLTGPAEVTVEGEFLR